MSEERIGKIVDLRVPMGVGTWAWGDRLLWGYGRDYTDADLKAAFDAASAAGIELFDTAEVYGWGESERLLGQFIRTSARSVYVATKFLPYPWRLRRESLVDALQASLARLGLDSVDLYQVHWPFPPVSVETWMDGMADAVRAGLIRSVGVSNYGLEQMRRAHAALARRGVPLASNQVQYNLLRRHPERDGLLAACRELDMSLIAYSPLAQGLLTGKYTPDNPPPGARGRLVSRRRLAQVQPLVSLIREIGAGHGKTPAQVALNWVICKGAIAIPGAKNARQAEENAGALGWQLANDEMAALDRATQML